MRHLRTISYAMTALGILLVILALAMNLSAAVLLSGLLLVVAGLVKVVMVAIWHGVAGFGLATPEDER